MGPALLKRTLATQPDRASGEVLFMSACARSAWIDRAFSVALERRKQVSTLGRYLAPSLLMGAPSCLKATAGGGDERVGGLVGVGDTGGGRGTGMSGPSGVPALRAGRPVAFWALGLQIPHPDRAPWPGSDRFLCGSA